MSTTLRNSILDQAVLRLQLGLGEQWTVARRFPGEDATGDGVRCAWVFDDGETVVRNDSMHTTKDLALQVLVQVQQEQADAEHGGNLDRALHDAVGLVEQVLLRNPQLDSCEQVLLDNWQPFGEPDELRARAVLRARARYRHNVGDPFLFAPTEVR